MAVPTLITDLSTVASSNFPAGPDSPALLDNVQRAHASFIAQLRDTKAAVGANSSITSLTGLTTPLSVAQGGTGDALGVGMTLIASATASNSASINFTSIGSYASYLLVCEGVAAANNSVYLGMRVSIGGVFQTTGIYSSNHFRFTNSASGIDGNAAATMAEISSTVELLGNAGGDLFYGNINLEATALPVEKHWTCQGSFVSVTPSFMCDVAAGRIATTSALDGFQLFMSAGTIATGVFKLYGLKA